MSDEEKPPRSSEEEPADHKLDFSGPVSGPVARWAFLLLPAVVALLLMMLAREVIQDRTPVRAEIKRSDAAFCDFREWMGKNVNDTDVAALGRPYRIIERDPPPRERGVPGRVNIQIDDNIVVRVWCG